MSISISSARFSNFKEGIHFLKNKPFEVVIKEIDKDPNILISLYMKALGSEFGTLEEIQGKEKIVKLLATIASHVHDNQSAKKAIQDMKNDVSTSLEKSTKSFKAFSIDLLDPIEICEKLHFNPLHLKQMMKQVSDSNLDIALSAYSILENYKVYKHLMHPERLKVIVNKSLDTNNRTALKYRVALMESYSRLSDCKKVKLLCEIGTQVLTRRLNKLSTFPLFANIKK